MPMRTSLIVAASAVSELGGEFLGPIGLVGVPGGGTEDQTQAAALGIAPCFAGIYGAKDDYKSFSKKMLIDRIISEHRLAGPEFVAFGDGFVEIEDTKRVGGIAVGVATDEARRTGIDEWKRNRLIEAGADLIVPDFREHERLMAFLWGE
jgi:phosphoglycolate phosphatase-like HAD superfamily hydrolase